MGTYHKTGDVSEGNTGIATSLESILEQLPGGDDLLLVLVLDLLLQDRLLEPTSDTFGLTFTGSGHGEEQQDAQGNRTASNDHECSLDTLNLTTILFLEMVRNMDENHTSNETTTSGRETNDGRDTSTFVDRTGDITQRARHHTGRSRRTEREEQSAKKHLGVDILNAGIDHQRSAEAEESNTVDRAATNTIRKDSPEEGRREGNDFVIKGEFTSKVSLDIIIDFEDEFEDKGLNDGEVGDKGDRAHTSGNVEDEVDVVDVLADVEDVEETLLVGVGVVALDRDVVLVGVLDVDVVRGCGGFAGVDFMDLILLEGGGELFFGHYEEESCCCGRKERG